MVWARATIKGVSSTLGLEIECFSSFALRTVPWPKLIHRRVPIANGGRSGMSSQIADVERAGSRRTPDPVKRHFPLFPLRTSRFILFALMPDQYHGSRTFLCYPSLSPFQYFARSKTRRFRDHTHIFQIPGFQYVCS